MAIGDSFSRADTQGMVAMMFTATWFAGEKTVSFEKAGSLAAARDIARSRLVAHRARSGATHVEVRSEDGALMFDSRQGMAPACARRPTLASQLIRRWSMPNTTPA